MVRALEVFRGNLLETERMRSKQADDAAKAEAHRREVLREMALSVESEAGSAVTASVIRRARCRALRAK